MAYAAVASSGQGFVDRTPLYMKRAGRSSSSLSFKDMRLSGTIAAVPESENVPEASAVDAVAQKAKPLQKFNRAVKRLKAARIVAGGFPKADLIASHSRIKKIISSAVLRHDVSFLSHVTPDEVSHAIDGDAKPLTALRLGSLGMIVWNVVQVILLVYVILYVPFRNSFADVDDANCQQHPFFQGFDLFVDTFYLLDLAISACTQTVNDQGKLLIHLKDTVPHYIFSWTFVRDLAPAVPISWIEYFNNSDDCEVVASSAGLAKLLRIMRIFRILRVLKLFNFKFLNDFLRHLDPNLKTLAGFFVSLIILVHLLACFFFYTKKDAPDIDKWFIDQNLASGSNRPLRIYLACVYFIVATLATVGYGDVHATQEDERVVMICIMLLGTIVFALIISTAGMIIQTSSMDGAAHGIKAAKVHEFCHYWQIPESLKYRILDFFLASKDIFLESINTKGVMQALPPEYQCAVAPHVAKACISKTILFKGSSPEFLSLLLELLELESFNVGEVVFRSGDVPDSMFIIKSGSCCIINDDNAVIAEYSDTDVFGEVSCYTSAPRACTCVCSMFSEIYVLHNSDLAQLCKSFPDFFQSFSLHCRRRILIDESCRSHLSALIPRLIHSERPDAALFPAAPSSISHQPTAKAPTSSPSPSISAKRPPMHSPLDAFRTPILPQAPKPNSHDIVSARSIQASEAQRIRAFAELQMALSNYDIGALALQYDRILNTVHQGSVGPSSRQSAVVASMLKTIQQIVSDSHILFRIDLSKAVAGIEIGSGSGYSIASHIVPGDASWQDSDDRTQIDINDTSKGKWAFTLSRALKKRETMSQTTIFDNREGLKYIYS